MTRLAATFLCFAGILACAGALQPLRAQSLRGRVTDAASAHPLPGVVVILMDRNGKALARTQTDADGRYLVQAEEAGSYRLRFEIPGYRMLFTELVNLKRGEEREYAARLTPATAVALDTVVVAGSTVPRHLLDFYLRRTRGLGTFLTPTDVEKLHPANPTDLVRRLEGFDLGYDRYDPSRKLIKNRRYGGTGRACTPVIFVDGAYVGTADSYDMDTALWVDKLDAVESYSSAARIPIEFNAAGSECGVIAIWTKR